ncbi:hypothetical protein RBH26_00240 [Natronolimnohabitans sp. A-GB9]|uniref:DUF7350 domain-containing protein n=1 Tax=Natronolimnohabitans sp. A-GB9 TaxID=3069757 RepID=UPI0027AF8172|nr:hypothetical protein [Natronolimnohabitans sp. A-GB9]MDQ2048906.1 hypothetical protein [Natronolimnohabitans sp. A-GB9]
MHEDDNDSDLDRRTLIKWTGTATGTLAFAGCLGFGDDSDEDGDESDDDTDASMPLDVEDLTRVENPPDAVYLPTHRESMEMLEPVEAGEYTLAPMLSYPHPFWLVTGSGEDEIERQTPEQMIGVHLMFTLWDDETDTVLPVDDGIELELAYEGDPVTTQSAWSMISQEMGFHFGDNVPLEDDGTYTVEVTLPALSVRTTGDLEGRFTDTETVTVEFEYDQAFRDRVSDVDYLDEEEWGERGALEPMGHGDHDHGDHADDGHHDSHGEHGEHHGDGHDHHDHDHDHSHDVPYSQLPEVEAFPGTILVEPDADRPAETAELPRSGDAAVLATLLESGFRLADGDDRYLLVSPRTPYNRVPLPAMNIEVVIERDGESVADAIDLEETIDDEYGHHYGASLADVQPGDTVTVTVVSPPQVARHQGYETAFLEMEPIELTVPEEQ